MGFPESLTTNVKRLAHFQCCMCKAIGVEIHHIIPTAENGPDTFENAAPLCPSCHETYGANPTKRKLIRQARDLWYEICEKRYAPDSSLLTEIRDAICVTASREDISNLRNDVVETLRTFAPPKNGLSFTVPKNTSSKRLSVRDYAVMIHGLSSDRPESQLGVLAMRELWPVKDGVRAIYKDFLELFGRIGLNHLGSAVLDRHDVPVEIGLTEDEIERAITVMSIEMVCLIELVKGEFIAELRDDGQIAWTSIASQGGAL